MAKFPNILVSLLALCVGLTGGVFLKSVFHNTDVGDWSERKGGIASSFAAKEHEGVEPDFIKFRLEEQFYPNLPREGFLISGHGENDIWVGGNASVEDIVKFGESYLIIFKAINTFDEINKRFGPTYALVVYAASEGTYKNIATDLDAANFYIGYENATEAKTQASVDGLDRVFVRFFVQSGDRSKVCRLVEVVREGSEVRIEPHQECPDSAG